LRRQDHVPRSVRRKTRDIHGARQALAAKLCRAPEDHEVAAALGVDLQTLWKWESDVEGAIRVPIDRPPMERGEAHSSPLDLLHTDPSEAIDERLGKEQEVAMLREAILKLKEQERTVLALYYFEELKLHEIATILELTESRVSQIRSKAISRLKGKLGVLREGLA
ncbi:MAG TPA: sigma-70 family RNA polymerase sigma factor, partial [Longimicrobiaceae bacterium]|nr:sigma-70 family RNA polymerase sigma factor [Longimicrobiaceae bacterium]